MTAYHKQMLIDLKEKEVLEKDEEFKFEHTELEVIIICSGFHLDS